MLLLLIPLTGLNTSAQGACSPALSFDHLSQLTFSLTCVFSAEDAQRPLGGSVCSTAVQNCSHDAFASMQHPAPALRAPLSPACCGNRAWQAGRARKSMLPPFSSKTGDKSPPRPRQSFLWLDSGSSGEKPGPRQDQCQQWWG